ncbi:DUF2487 family protein [Sporosarcina sp. NCCP-2716]|uniref:DUF2487 family protein n=1 Tax=Sporosarcina sp. NCCP-2716 TaxID=2943679 RepID=UPI0020418DC0|nr:DUF2487 family protein [Sporosarcina sp. NCCP-2716]
MNWNAADMNTYLQQKEYIDTAIVPLIKMETAEGRMKASASSADFLMNLSSFIEQQFKGRVMVTPPFSYSPSMDLSVFSSGLASDMADSPFRHIFYLTTDAAWTSITVKGTVLWLPPIPIENMDERLKHSILEDQLKQLLPSLTEAWAK